MFWGHLFPLYCPCEKKISIIIKDGKWWINYESIYVLPSGILPILDICKSVFKIFFHINIYTIFERFYLFDRPLLMRQFSMTATISSSISIDNRQGDTLVQRFILTNIFMWITSIFLHLYINMEKRYKIPGGIWA